MPHDETLRTGRVRRARLDREELAALLQRGFGGEEATRAFILRFRADEREFLRFAPDRAEALVAGWEEGRVFSRSLEVRWREAGGAYDVLLLSEGDGVGAAPDAEPVGDAAGYHAPTGMGERMLLWGTRAPDGESWLEARIPRPLRYPAAAGTRPPRLECVHYVDRESGAVAWTRFCEVTADET